MIKDATFDDVKPYASRAAKEGVSIKQTPTTIWFTIWDDETFIGFGGLLIKGNKARVKADWILPEHRGKGYGHELTEHRIAMCQKNPRIKVMEAYSLHPNYYARIGWKNCGLYREGTHIVRRAV